MTEQTRPRPRLGRRPVKLHVHGCLMSVGEAAAKLGVSRQSIQAYRERHRYPDGTPLSLNDAYNAYARARRRGKRRVGHGGPEPRTYALGGGQLTIIQAAEALGVSRSTVWRYLKRCDGDLERAWREIEKWQMKRAERQIMAILHEKREQGTGSGGGIRD